MNDAHLMTTDQWSYIRYGDGTEELYDRHKDPRQFFNLSGEAAYSRILAELNVALTTKLEEVGRLE